MLEASPSLEGENPHIFDPAEQFEAPAGGIPAPAYPVEAGRLALAYAQEQDGPLHVDRLERILREQNLDIKTSNNHIYPRIALTIFDYIGSVVNPREEVKNVPRGVPRSPGKPLYPLVPHLPEGKARVHLMKFYRDVPHEGIRLITKFHGDYRAKADNKAGIFSEIRLAHELEAEMLARNLPTATIIADLLGAWGATIEEVISIRDQKSRGRIVNR